MFRHWSDPRVVLYLWRAIRARGWQFILLFLYIICSNVKSNEFGGMDMNSSNNLTYYGVVRVFGADASDTSGSAVRGAGDVNGDGIDDIMISAPSASPLGRTSAGIVYIIFGRLGGFENSTIDLRTFTTSYTTGFRVLGAYASGNLGIRTGGNGDFNGDGIDDIVVGCNRGNPGTPPRISAGEVYVLFGHDAKSYNVSDIDTLTFTTNLSIGFRMLGAVSSDSLGTFAGSAGDVNEDGIDDIVVSAPAATSNGRSSGGMVYVIYGRNYTSYEAKDIDILTFQFTSTSGFQIFGGNAGDGCGRGTDGIGDVNGDGIDDIAVGCYAADPLSKSLAGLVYVIFGRNSSDSKQSDIDLLTFTGGSDLGYIILGAHSGDRCGWSVRGAGDVNGDGIGDIIIGCQRAQLFSKQRRESLCHIRSKPHSYGSFFY